MSSANLSLALEYLGIHFQRFVFTLQGTAGEPIPQEVDWYQHVLAEVVHVIFISHYFQPQMLF